MSRRQTRSKAAETEEKSDQESRNYSQKLLLVPKTIFKDENLGDGNAAIVTLRNPKTGNGDLFLFCNQNSDIYQLMQFKEKFRSWFIDNSVEEDGSLTFATYFDPLFLILPYLREVSRYRPLEQIVEDDKFPECNRLLSCKGVQQQMNLISDIKESNDLTAYCYSDEKCMRWLSAKVERLAKVLLERNIHVASGAQSVTFIRNKKERDVNEDDFRRYAHGIISDYLADDVSRELQKHLKIPEAIAADRRKADEELDGQNSIKRPRFADNIGEPLEDYSKLNRTDPKIVQKDPKPLTAAQKALEKVDKKGMKSMLSFFGKK